MSLPSGTKLGPYEIVCAIGAGGMGEVYRAKDTRLGRDVAIKVLPEALARSHSARLHRTQLTRNHHENLGRCSELGGSLHEVYSPESVRIQKIAPGAAS